tara:strand:- start:1665 stop:1877 length:213 start_codon:yes stop_codon:yes gene_type:complete
MDSFAKIYSGSSIKVLSIKDMLEKNNIIPIIKDQSESSRLAGFGSLINFQEVFVHESEVSKALKFLKDIL